MLAAELLAGDGHRHRRRAQKLTAAKRREHAPVVRAAARTLHKL
jgi:hypothetical protein